MEFAIEGSSFCFLAADSEFEASVLRKIPIENVVKMLLQDVAVMRFTGNDSFHPVIPEFIMLQGSVGSVAQLTAEMLSAPEADTVPDARTDAETDTVERVVID